ncbi:MAG: HAD hydrolase family protein, partial [Clostridiales bacterium]|nr:HAD hydrolase family protein [Clostridiales bacterium]
AERGLRCASQIDETHYANFPATKLWPLVKTVETADFSAHRLDAEKLYALVETPADEAFVRENLPDGLILHISYDGMAMAMHKDASKSGAIAKLAKMWGISRDEVAACGDDLNDSDMLAFAGYGVAVANAKPEVKSAADFACGANDEDGVAQWLEENVL